MMPSRRPTPIVATARGVLAGAAGTVATAATLEALSAA